MRKIKQATLVSHITTNYPFIKDNHVIGFSKKDLIGLDLPHNDALVICIQIEKTMIERVHVDDGSATNILQLFIIQQMELENKITKLARSLTNFKEAMPMTVGIIKLGICLSPMVCSQDFLVIDELFPYNDILDRPWISMIDAITSAMH